MPLHAHSCGAVVVRLLYTATTTSRASANNNKHMCYWLSMSIGGSGGTAVKYDNSRGCPLWYGGSRLVCLPFVASAASVLCCLTVVPDIICPGMNTYVFCVGAVFCDRLPFLFLAVDPSFLLRFYK